MTNELAAALARIEKALMRVEAARLARPVGASETDGDGRYHRLRSRTQAALAELDTVIARVAREERT